MYAGINTGQFAYAVVVELILGTPEDIVQHIVCTHQRCNEEKCLPH